MNPVTLPIEAIPQWGWWYNAAEPQPKKRLTTEATEITERSLWAFISVVSVTSVVSLFSLRRRVAR
jgi:hypothetical protein